MPYIEQSERNHLDRAIKGLAKKIDQIPCEQSLPVGILNYCITRLLLSTNPSRYTDYNSLIGVLECVKLELYRRAVGPYENGKAEENGDVY